MNYLLTGVGLLIGVAAYSQQLDPSSRIQTSPPVKSTIERYKEDYELQSYSFENGDSTILLQLDVESLEVFRPATGTFVVVDPNTGLNVILYSRKYQLTAVNPDKTDDL